MNTPFLFSQLFVIFLLFVIFCVSLKLRSMTLAQTQQQLDVSDPHWSLSTRYTSPPYILSCSSLISPFFFTLLSRSFFTFLFLPLFSLVVPSKPRLQPGVLSPIEQRLEDGNRAKRQEKDDTHDVSIELRAFQSSVPTLNSKEDLTVA